MLPIVKRTDVMDRPAPSAQAGRLQTLLAPVPDQSLTRNDLDQGEFELSASSPGSVRSPVFGMTLDDLGEEGVYSVLANEWSKNTLFRHNLQYSKGESRAILSHPRMDHLLDKKWLFRIRRAAGGSDTFL